MKFNGGGKYLTVTECGMHGVADAREANMRRCIEERNKISNWKDGVVRWMAKNLTTGFKCRKRKNARFYFTQSNRIHTFMKSIKM